MAALRSANVAAARGAAGSGLAACSAACSAPLSQLTEHDAGLELEAAAVHRRLREHEEDLRDEAREIEALRIALQSRAEHEATARAAAADGRGTAFTAHPGIPDAPGCGGRGRRGGRTLEPGGTRRYVPGLGGGGAAPSPGREGISAREITQGGVSSREMVSSMAAAGRRPETSFETLPPLQYPRPAQGQETWWEAYRRDVLHDLTPSGSSLGVVELE